jgi:hypothetical protein
MLRKREDGVCPPLGSLDRSPSINPGEIGRTKDICAIGRIPHYMEIVAGKEEWDFRKGDMCTRTGIRICFIGYSISVSICIQRVAVQIGICI